MSQDQRNDLPLTKKLAYKPPVRVPFESTHTQVFPGPEGHKTVTTFYREQIATSGGEVKMLNYSLDCVFRPEKKYRGRRANEPAMMSVHVHALVTDLVATDPEAKND